MNELQLREFRTRAEELVDLPDLAELESRGRRLRQRRMALGAGVAAAVLAVTGGLVAANQRDDGDPTPIEPPDDRAPSEIVYPGAVMEILDAGTYLLQPSLDADAPRARVTLPEGWNAWEGPNRFDGDLETNDFYAGMLVVDVDAVASRPCQGPRSDDVVGDGGAELVAALQGLPGAQVRIEKVPDEMFGYPATHLRMTFPVPARKCQTDVNVFVTSRHGIIGGADDTMRDAWVVDVDGNAILVTAGYSTKTPPEIRDELYAIVDSIEFVDPE